ncbi:Ribosomal RNA large subunit methyltransferase A [Marinobacter nitratireducens]|uniref:Ribosomal RNA large subunit methyltransferase A n=1 Tax=Marinobacter nitratireducens TaxID=1137280 RepID=A0A072N4D3_9GAMM|nr:methyltransferase domain-containing protein [Marinobacter nitratireducens]KEF32386.1 Ribosomal RNA large subunit methyltransferase A [Marinobacter nitratireducens]
MTISPFQSLACPLDGTPLTRSDRSWTCCSGHSFDIARQGYVHLLPVQKKRSKDPGDSKEMVAARQRFLNTGHYGPIADAVNRAVLEGSEEGELACLDAGCGEGYYLRKLAASIPVSLALSALGLDISKWAVLAAAKQEKGGGYVVGSNANLPVLPGSVDRVLCLFGFPVYSEFHRVLRPGGRVIQVDAGPDHLRELREIIYPELKPTRDRDPAAPEGFSAVSTEEIRYELALDGRDTIGDLLAMTPHLYRASAEGREKAQRLESIRVTVSALVRVLEKL